MAKIPTGELLRQYIAMRERRDACTRQAKTINAMMERVEAVLLKRMQDDETDRFAIDGITAFKTTHDKAHVKDREAFLAFVLEGGRVDMLTSAVTQDAVKDFLATSGQLPPGVAFNSIVKVNVRKSV
jgi:hypothetical protein